MLQVAPAPADAPLADSPSRPPRRHVTDAEELSPVALAFGFRPLVSPSTRYSLLATLAVCILLQLVVGAPYAANERAADASPALRGLIVGILLYHAIGPTSLLSAPTLVRGSFHRRFLLSLPITLAVSVAVAFIPLEGSTTGIISIQLIAYGLAYILCILSVNSLYATDEHKALDQSFGPPVVAIAVLFFGLVTAYVTLTTMYSNPLVGLLLPGGLTAVRVLGIFALVRSCHTFYYEPKQSFAQLPPAQSHANVAPPLLGDIEAQYGSHPSIP
jgi:hypothetical protein